MSAITNSTKSGYTAVKFEKIGDGVAGRIVGFEDYQVQDWQTKQPKFFAQSGDPIMGTRVDLETEPGNENSRVSLYAEKVRMMQAIGGALKAAGAEELAVGDDLAVTHTGMDGRAKTFEAVYSKA